MIAMTRVPFSPPIVLALALACVLHACDKTPTSPGDNSPFNRSSIWHFDTLPDTEIEFYRIWAADPTNVFLAGTRIRRYDGSHWPIVPFSYNEGGPFFNFGSINGILGFSANDVWMVGSRMYYNPTPTSNFDDSLLLVRYNGSSWTDLRYPGYGLHSIWGPSPTNVWVGGRSGEMFHYNGSTLVREPVAFSLDEKYYWYFSDIVGSDNETPYAVVSAHYGSGSSYLLRRIQSTWIVLDSLYSTGKEITQLWMSPSRTLYGVGRYVYRWNGSSWETFRQSPDLPRILNILGTADDNIFIVGYQGFFSHWNGTDWFDIRNIFPGQWAGFQDIWSDGSNVFLVGHDSTHKAIIVHN